MTALSHHVGMQNAGRINYKHLLGAEFLGHYTVVRHVNTEPAAILFYSTIIKNRRCDTDTDVKANRPFHEAPEAIWSIVGTNSVTLSCRLSLWFHAHKRIQRRLLIHAQLLLA